MQDSLSTLGPSGTRVIRGPKTNAVIYAIHTGRYGTFVFMPRAMREASKRLANRLQGQFWDLVGDDLVGVPEVDPFCDLHIGLYAKVQEDKRNAGKGN